MPDEPTVTAVAVDGAETHYTPGHSNGAPDPTGSDQNDAERVAPTSEPARRMEMSKSITLAGAALSVLALSVAAAQAGNGGVKLGKIKIGAIPACAVAGTPSEFPDDVMIVNKGLAPLAAGTEVHWSVPSAGKQGNYTLAAALAPGKGVYVSGVLGGGVEAGRPCKASI